MNSESNFPTWLTYHRDRRERWVEHDSPPVKAIAYWKNTLWSRVEDLKIYKITEEGQMVPHTIEEVLAIGK